LIGNVPEVTGTPRQDAIFVCGETSFRS